MDEYAQMIWDGEDISLDGAINAWGERFDLLHLLEETPQEPIWHAEGNVAIHTQMVIDEALLQLDGANLSARARFTLQMAALFHDIAKPLVTATRFVRGADRIVAPRHAQRGASWLMYRILDLDLPLDVVYDILALVHYHHDPKFLIIKEKEGRAFRRLDRWSCANLLYMLELADMRGRRCDDRDKNIELIEMYRLFSEEAGAGQAPYQGFVAHVVAALSGESIEFTERALREGIWDWDAGQIYTPEEAVSRSFGLKTRFCHVVMGCGPSGSGKTSWLKEHYPDYCYIGLDALRAEVTGQASDQSENNKVFHLARERFKEALRQEKNIVWDATVCVEIIEKQFWPRPETTTHTQRSLFFRPHWMCVFRAIRLVSVWSRRM